jgi:hypothetical protein
MQPQSELEVLQRDPFVIPVDPTPDFLQLYQVGIDPIADDSRARVVRPVGRPCTHCGREWHSWNQAARRALDGPGELGIQRRRKPARYVADERQGDTGVGNYPEKLPAEG